MSKKKAYCIIKSETDTEVSCDETTLETNINQITEEKKESSLQVPLHPNGNKYDISNFLHQFPEMSDNEKMDLIDNVWRPESDFNFPNTILKYGRKASLCLKISG